MRPILVGLIALCPPLDGSDPAPVPGAVETAGSLDAIRRGHDRSLFDDLLAFIPRHGDGPDREEAHRLLFDLAIRYAWYAEADAAARAYVEGPTRGDATPLGQLVSAMADAEAGRLRAAIVLYRELMAGLDDEADARLAADLADTMADLALASGDAASAREIYTCFLDHFGAVPGAAAKVEAEFARIALLGSPAPTIEASDVEWRSVALGPGAGHTLVVFWAASSEPCLAELPALIEAEAAYRDRGLRVIGVGLDGSAEELASITRERSIRWRPVHNATSGADWAGPLRVTGVPSTFLIGPDGTILRMGLRGEAIARTLGEVLGPATSE